MTRKKTDDNISWECDNTNILGSPISPRSNSLTVKGVLLKKYFKKCKLTDISHLCFLLIVSFFFITRQLMSRTTLQVPPPAFRNLRPQLRAGWPVLTGKKSPTAGWRWRSGKKDCKARTQASHLHSSRWGRRQNYWFMMELVFSVICF